MSSNKLSHLQQETSSPSLLTCSHPDITHITSRNESFNIILPNSSKPKQCNSKPPSQQLSTYVLRNSTSNKCNSNVLRHPITDTQMKNKPNAAPRNSTPPDPSTITLTNQKSKSLLSVINSKILFVPIMKQIRLLHR